MGSELKGKNIVLGVCGGIAAYKAVELLRLLAKMEADVRVIMTRNATEFVGPLTFQALSGHPVSTSLFARGEDASIHHIAWAQEADAVIVAPATANLIGKLAGGIADDALSTFLLAVTSPILLCPSMNTHMYESPPVQRNLRLLAQDGYHLLVPDAGQLACGTEGPGRLPDPPLIADRAVKLLAAKDLEGCRILVTAGPTREFLDPVRFISNPSSGKMGYAIARAAEHRGAEVILISGPTGLPDPYGVTVCRVETAEEMAQEVFARLETAEVAIKAAAVSDYRALNRSPHKVKKGAKEVQLDLRQNMDILKEVGHRKNGRLLVGFAAETEDLSANAAKKMAEKNLDLIVGNLVNAPDAGFGVDTNTVTLFYRSGAREEIPNMTKDAVAHLLLDRVAALWASSRENS